MIKTITKVEKLKEGSGAKGPWVLSKVTDAEGKTYTTFGNFTPHLNSEVEVIIEQNPNGRQGDMNIKLIEPKRAEKTDSLGGEMLLEMKVQTKLLREIEKNTRTVIDNSPEIGPF